MHACISSQRLSSILFPTCGHPLTSPYDEASERILVSVSNSAHFFNINESFRSPSPMSFATQQVSDWLGLASSVA